MSDSLILRIGNLFSTWTATSISCFELTVGCHSLQSLCLRNRRRNLPLILGIGLVVVKEMTVIAANHKLGILTKISKVLF